MSEEIGERDRSLSGGGSLLDGVAVWLATGFGIGFVPFAPGTFGTLLGLLVTWGLFQWLPSMTTFATVCLVLLLISCPICGRAARRLGRHDPGSVVLDEIAALQLVFLAVDFRVDTAVAGFLTFRLFDILKPWPIRQLERFPGGWGIVADDVGAGVYAALCTWGFTQLLGL